ncbi:hypothetical protein AXG93_2891s1260 [Marchantia polymorpha subsp. ruderalis]|uniref:Uncharacterized protein n=1 Tax=Marchantia polymorpha subsp. ruderalis TaxID=1480154 RepID=A0A176WP91_MARPO|nr:hypothetical protein AXG93_2891s1260 [Marchantia polymorpha subsp. ruderalis]
MTTTEGFRTLEALCLRFPLLPAVHSSNLCSKSSIGLAKINPYLSLVRQTPSQRSAVPGLDRDREITRALNQLLDHLAMLEMTPTVGTDLGSGSHVRSEEDDVVGVHFEPGNTLWRFCVSLVVVVSSPTYRLEKIRL